MRFIAITGSFACGKSFVLKSFKKLGYKVFSCDDYVRNLYLNLEIQKDIIRIIDIPVFDKLMLIKAIYNDDIKRKKLENYIHPIVREGINDFKNKYSDEKFLFVEIPLLFETGFNDYFDYSVCVFCSEETRLKRAVKRSNFNLEIYEKIMISQLPQETKKNLADFQINTENFTNIKKQINKIIERFQ